MLIPVVESLWLQSGPYIRIAARIHTEEPDISGTHHHWRLVEALEQQGRGRGGGGAEGRHHPFLRPDPAAAEPPDAEPERTARYG